MSSDLDVQLKHLSNLPLRSNEMTTPIPNPSNVIPRLQNHRVVFSQAFFSDIQDLLVEFHGAF
jgi:hypothetical protein